MNAAQRKKYASFLNFVGKRFKDTDDNGEQFEGVVIGLFMYDSEPCFLYEISGRDCENREFIVAKSLINDATWETPDNIISI